MNRAACTVYIFSGKIRAAATWKLISAIREALLRQWAVPISRNPAVEKNDRPE